MNIVLLDAQTLGEVSLEPLQQFGQLTVYAHTQSEEVIERCRDAHVVITNKVVIGAQIMQQLNNLKLICVAATGTNNIDLNTAKSFDIAVTNVAGYSTPSVVQHTFALISNLLGNVHRYAHDCQVGEWQKSAMFCRLDHTITEIYGKKIAIIGFGTLGQAVAQVAKAYGAQVLVAEQRQRPDTRAGRVPFIDAVKQADIVSIHCPLTSDTENLFDLDTLALMKSSAILINTARGGIVNEHALAKALNKKMIAGAATDVLSEEPANADNPLIQYQGNNLLVTPHVAWASNESITRLVAGIAQNIADFCNNKQTNRVV